MPSAVSACAPLEDGPSLNATAAVLEVKPFHYEVLPTAVRLLQAAGAAHVSLLLRNNKNNREYDAVAQMQVWAPVRVLRHGSQIAAYLREARPSLIMVNTFDDLISDRRGGRNGTAARAAADTSADAPPPEARSKLLSFIGMIASANPRQALVAGCHNLQPCLRMLALVRSRHPRLRITPMALTAGALSPLANASRAWARPFASIPFFFGPDRPAAASAVEATRILVVGRLDPSRRNFGALRGLARARLPARVEFIFFGRCPVRVEHEKGGCSRLRASLRAMVGHHPNVSLSFHEGAFSTLYQLARGAAYVAPLVDASVREFDRYAQEKLTSSLAVATGFQLPVIGSQRLLEGYGLPEGQIAYPSDGARFADAVAEAVRVRLSDAPRYEAMRAAQCAFRRVWFARARERVTELLRAGSRK